MDKRKCLMILSIFMMLVLFTIPTQASVKNKWVLQSGRYCYYNEQGQKLKGGVRKIDGKKYYFDAKGCQKTGWIKSGGQYMYFRPKRAEKGYRVRNKTINGFKINKKGIATVPVAKTARMNCLIKAARKVEKLSNWNMTRTEALKACFSYVRNHMNYANIGSFKMSNTWDADYALRFFDTNRGDCYTAGCGFAYMAAAIGYKNVFCISSGQHGWGEIGGYVYDPAWANSYDPYGFKYFRLDYNMSGYDGVPMFKGCRIYAVRLS